MPGIGFTLGIGGRGGGLLDPTTLPLTGFWRASYTGSPWTGTASTGGSGARNISDANAPDVGSAVNGFTPADFIPANSDILRMVGFTLDTFVNADAGSMWVLFFADTASAPVGAGTAAEPFEQPAIVSTASGGHWHMCFNTDGLTCAVFDSAYRVVTRPCSTGAWHLGQMTWIGGTSVNLRLDGGPRFSTASTGNIPGGGLALGMHVGTNYSEAQRVDMKILEIGLADFTFPLATEDGIRAQIISRYGVAV